MAQKATPHFHNSEGYETIAIGVKRFQCVGALPPFDHPHVFLDMGDEQQIVCPYCSTLYVFKASVGVNESEPADCLMAEPA